MTQEDKLKLFFDVTVDDAKKQNLKVVSAFQESQEVAFVAHKEDAEAKAAIHVKLKRESLIRHKNSETAKKQIELRREYAQKQEQLKVKLFQSVLGKIFEFKKTDAYLEYMKHCIEKADQFANGEDMTIYVDSTDQSLIETFQSYVDAPILVTDEHLIGGVRIVIPTKNVLIDESFFSKIEEEKHKFIF